MRLPRVVKQQTCEQRAACVLTPATSDAVRRDQLLDLVEGVTINDWLVLAGKRCAVVASFAEIGAVLKELGERAIGEWNASHDLADDQPLLGYDPLGVSQVWTTLPHMVVRWRWIDYRTTADPRNESAFCLSTNASFAGAKATSSQAIISSDHPDNSKVLQQQNPRYIVASIPTPGPGC